MLRLSRFRGRKGVVGREFWQACGGGIDDNAAAPWEMQQQSMARGISSIALDGSSSNHQSNERYNAKQHGVVDAACSRVPSRGFSDEPSAANPAANQDARNPGGMDRINIQATIGKNRMLQDEVGKFLYGSNRGQADPKLLLGTLYIKAGMPMPTYSSGPSQGHHLGSVVANGKRFKGPPAKTPEEAELNAATSALNWLLGRTQSARDSTRGDRGGLTPSARGGRGGGAEARGRGRGRGSGPKGKVAQRVAVRAIGCMQVEVNYKLMKAVVLYPTTEILYPYKQFPARQNLKAVYRGEENQTSSSSNSEPDPSSSSSSSSDPSSKEASAEQ